MLHRNSKLLHQIVAGSDFIGDSNRYEADLGDVRHQEFTVAGASESPNRRARSCEYLSPGACVSCRRSSGVSMSRAIPASESTTHDLSVATAAARCGMKLSFPNRNGNRAAGRRRTALVPRLSPEGTRTVPFSGALS